VARYAVLAALMLVAVVPVVQPAARGQGPLVSVLADFGDGTYRWADVELPPTNVTALKATELANSSWGLPPLEATWAASPFCVRSPCAFVDDIGDRGPVYPFWWHFFLWNETADAWDPAPYGPSDTDLVNGDAIGWYLAVDDPATFAWPRPAPTPEFRDAWASFRGDLSNQGRAHGVIPVTGRVLWSASLNPDLDPPPEVDATPVVADGRVFVGTRNQIAALDANSGAVVWRRTEVSILLSTPAVYDRHLVVGGTDGGLHYLDATTGEEAWRAVLEIGVQSTGIASSPAVHGGRAYVGTFNETAGGPGRVAAVNLNNGTIAWTFETASVHMSSPAIADGRLFVGLMGRYDGVVGYAPPYGVLSLWLNGSESWFFPTRGPVASSPAVRDGVIYFTEKNGTLHAVRTDGSAAWNRTIGPSTSSPAVSDDRLFVASGGLDGSGKVYAFDFAGGIAWERDVGPVQASLVTDGRLVCGATNAAAGTHFCLRASDGTPLWEHAATNYVLGSMSAVGDTLYAVDDAGMIWAFRDPGPSPTPAFPWLIVAIPAAFIAVAASVMLRRWRRNRKGGSPDA